MLSEEQPPTAETTGRFVVALADDESDAAGVLRSAAGVAEVADSRDLHAATADDGSEARVVATAEATLFAELGLAVVAADPERMRALQASTERPRGVLDVAPELVHHVLSEQPATPPADGAAEVDRSRADAADDTDAATWGLQACRVLDTERTGAGVRVAVLDTGFDLDHPDFADRDVRARSFVDGERPQDGHGHGTHCVGTACGPRRPGEGRRYGVATRADVVVGKVLSNEGSGSDGQILAGIDWAVGIGCAIVSMSLGASIRDVHPPYTTAGRRALARGSLIVAAAGNNATRPDDPGFVGTPANSPHVLAVGALDQRLGVAPFSARSTPGRGGQVDIAAPGVDVYSSWPMPKRYHTISGTSMATPHVAGLAALWAEAGGLRGRELWAVLVQFARRLGEPSLDVGAGLALAPR